MEHPLALARMRAVESLQETDPTASAERSLLNEGLAELELDVSEKQREALLELAAILEQWAERINLTAHRSGEAIVRRLILDAAALSKVLPDAARIADLGSGAGFPGLPLAILRPDSTLTSIEARERRHYFQRAAIRTLGLSNAHAEHGRLESLTPTPHDLVISQALAKPGVALEWMTPWAAPGGLLAIPGGATPPVLPEVKTIESQGVTRYAVPCGGPERTLWLGRRRSA